MGQYRSSTWLAGLIWLAFAPACQLTEEPPGKSDPFAFRGNFAIALPGAMGGIRMDTPFEILWTTHAAHSSGRVSVFLHSDSGDYPLAENLPDTGGLKVRIGERRIPNVDAFRVKVIDAGDPDRIDFSVLFAMLPFHGSRVYFRNLAAGSILKLDSNYTFGLELPPGAPQGLDVSLMWNDTSGASLRSSISGSDLTINLSGQNVGSGAHIRFKLWGRHNGDGTKAYLGMSAPFSIVSDYFGGAIIAEPGPSDTLVGGTLDTLMYAKRGNPGATFVSGLYSDSIWIGRVSIVQEFDFGDTQMVAWKVPMGFGTGSRFRIGISSSSDPGLPVSLSARFAILGIVPDAFEHDNDAESAKELRLGEAPQMHTLPEGDTDWIWFETETGMSYAIQTRCAEHFEIEVMQESSGFALPIHHAFSRPGITTYIVRPGKSGRYRAKIGSIWPGQNESGASYSISLHPVSFDSTGPLLSFAAPIPGTRIEAGSMFSLRWIPDTVLFDSTVRLELHRDSTLVQTLSEGAPNSGNFDWGIDPWMATSSLYRIRISQIRLGPISGYSPQFTIHGKPPDPYEPDDNRKLAGSIEPGGAAQSRSLLASDVDWVTFDCVKGRSYSVDAKSAFPLILSVHADILRTTGGISPSISQMQGEGRCAIEVQTFQSHHGEYVLSVTSEEQP